MTKKENQLRNKIKRELIAFYATKAYFIQKDLQGSDFSIWFRQGFDKVALHTNSDDYLIRGIAKLWKDVLENVGEVLKEDSIKEVSKEEARLLTTLVIGEMRMFFGREFVKALVEAINS